MAMMAEGKKQKQQQSSHCLYVTKWFQRSTSSELSHKFPLSPDKEPVDRKRDVTRKPGGWKAMPFILGNDTFERLAAFGLLANFMVYLTRMLHLDQVSASNIINVWSGLTNFAPLLGAFFSDAYIGRFRTIAFASIFSLMGMATITLTAWLPQLHPPPCNPQQQALSQCTGPTRAQLGLLLLGLGFLSIGSGGIRPCSIPFGVDQFDPTTEEGKKGVKSFFNWYYATFTMVLLITQTVVVYIQDKVSWSLGFGIPTVLMACSILLLLIGSRVYVHAKPQGSMFSAIAQVLVAAHKKRHVKLAEEAEMIEVDKFYDPPIFNGHYGSKLPLTNQLRFPNMREDPRRILFVMRIPGSSNHIRSSYIVLSVFVRFLNKAAVILDNDLKPDGCPVDNWRLCSVQQVEELKCVLKTIPIWSTAIVSLTAMTQQGTFTVSQALKMDRHLGANFEVPAGSISVISFLTIGLWLPIYDRIIVPSLRKFTKLEGGITVLQRCGIGIIFSVLSMAVAGVIEKERRDFANLHPDAHVSFLWLAPQLILMGLCEAFNIIGLLEFFNREFPDHMRSVGNALLSCSFAGSSYLSSFMVTVVHHVTGTEKHPDWLANDLNAGRLDYFYFLLAGIGVLTFAYFLFCAQRYHYKATNVNVEEKPYDTDHVQLGSTNA